MRRMLGRLMPVMARMPSTASIQRMSKTPATSLNGLGKRLIARPTSARMRRSTMLMTWPLIVNSAVSGMFMPSILRYPNTQRAARMTISTANLGLGPSTMLRDDFVRGFTLPLTQSLYIYCKALL